MILKKINIILSTLNVVLVVFGYSLVTSIFGESMLESGSQSVTIPYHFFTVVVSLTVVFLNRRDVVFVNTPIKVICLFWILLAGRLFSDLYLGNVGYVSQGEIQQKWLYIIGKTWIPMLSVVLSMRAIDFDRLAKWSLMCVMVAIALSFMNNEHFLESDYAERVDANVALNTISTGHLGLSGIVLVVFFLVKHNNAHIIQKMLLILCLVVCFVFMMRAGSRGPVLVLLLLLSIYSLSITRNTIKNFLLFLLVGVLLLVCIDYVEMLIERISPVMHARLFLREDQLSDRRGLYDAAWNLFLENPLFGKRFALYSNGKICYSHNSILDSMMALGIVGLFLICYLYIYAIRRVSLLIKNRASTYWVGLLLLQFIFKTFTSGAFWICPEISVLFVFVAMPQNIGSVSKGSVAMAHLEE